MQVPKRKSENFKRTKADPIMTKAKYLELKEKLARLLQKRPALIEETQRLAQLGDFSENAEYQIAKGKLRGTNNRILELEYQINHAEIIEPTQGGHCQVGSRITVELNGTKKTFEILGSCETNPSVGVISRHSPIGSALIGSREGDTVKIQLANKEATCKIIKIE
ncbi:MAG: GreA/GreB family elongation factor [Parcubacteria group bacterium]